LNKPQIIKIVRRWLADFVIEFNVCPFAGRELREKRILFEVTDATTESQLLADLERALLHLQENPSVETSLLIHPQILQNFADYNDFLGVAELLLQQMQLEGEFQIASFHPDYQFAGTQVDAAENFTNRSPFPLLHLLRESSVSRAVEHHPDVVSIPANNIETMNRIGAPALRRLLANIKAGQG
jgi:hypothetical protein